jgi:hypothetical protein
MMVYHGRISRDQVGQHAVIALPITHALSRHGIPHVLWGDYLWITAFRVPTAVLDTIYFIVPPDRVDAAAQAVSAELHEYKRCPPSTPFKLSGSSESADFPKIAVLTGFVMLAIFPSDLVAFDPTDRERTTSIEYVGTHIPVPTMPGLLDSCFDVLRALPPPSRLKYGWIDWLVGRTLADIQHERERNKALRSLASIALGYILMCCLRKEEQGQRWKCIEDMPQKHHRIAEYMRPENKQPFFKEFLLLDGEQASDLENGDSEQSDWEEEDYKDIDNILLPNGA